MSNNNEQAAAAADRKKKKKQNPLVNILFNIVVPVVILSKFSNDNYLGPKLGLVVALAFPLAYFIWDWRKEHKANFISILGFVSVLLTGIIGVFEFPSELIAYKEASVPLIICLAVLISMKTPYPLVKKLLYNEDLMNMELINSRLSEKDNTKEVDRMLVRASYMVAASFLVSTVLNFGLAKYLIHSPSGTPEFAEEMARMTALSYPVIALPSTIVLVFALFYVYNRLSKLTGLEFEQLFNIDFDTKDKTDENDCKSK
ncbi:MAG: MFS transporter [Bacteroidales bacterium]|nr:MFS transporter [Bacteroidales bacterium]